MQNSKRGRETLEKLTTLANYFLLSLLWFFFSLPVITIGASTSALYATHYQYMEKKEGAIFATFWKFFKNSFVQATAVWSVYLFVLVIMGWNRFLMEKSLGNSMMSAFSQVFLLIVCVLAIPVLWYSLAYIARFKDPLKKIVVNSSIFALMNFKNSISLLVFTVLAVIILWLVPILVVVIPAYGINLAFKKIDNILIQYDPTSNHETI